MGGGFNKREPTDTKRIYQRPPMVENFLIYQWMGFFEHLKGYDDDIT